MYLADATDLKGKIIEGEYTIGNTHRIIKGVFKKLKDDIIIVNTSEKVDDFLSMDSEDYIHVEDVTHIDGVAVTFGYETRPVEMYYGNLEANHMDTEYIHIPYDTPENKIREVALEIYSKEIDIDIANKIAKHEYSADMVEGFEIIISELPKNVYKIRFTNSF